MPSAASASSALVLGHVLGGRVRASPTAGRSGARRRGWRGSGPRAARCCSSISASLGQQRRHDDQRPQARGHALGQLELRERGGPTSSVTARLMRAIARSEAGMRARSAEQGQDAGARCRRAPGQQGERQEEAGQGGDGRRGSPASRRTANTRSSRWPASRGSRARLEQRGAPGRSGSSRDRSSAPREPRRCAARPRPRAGREPSPAARPRARTAGSLARGPRSRGGSGRGWRSPSPRRCGRRGAPRPPG